MVANHRDEPSPARNAAPPPQQPETGSRSDLLHDRRRPGRLKNPNPALIALMRGQSIYAPDGHSLLPNIHTLPDDAAPPSAPHTDIENDLENGIRDDLRAPRGIITGLAISILLWAAMIGAGWLAYTLT